MHLWNVCLQERRVLVQQAQATDTSTKRMAEQHKQKIALLEKQSLQQKQQLLRGILCDILSEFF